MTNIETRRYDTLLRVRDFGTTHRGLFPASSPGGQAFEALSTLVTQLGEHAVSKRSTTREGRQKKKVAREALLGYMDTMARCARVIARDVPKIDDTFRLGRLRSDQAIVTTGRTFAREAATQSGHFITNGMPPGFVSELNRLVDECEQAIRNWEGAKDGHTSARVSIASALDEGFALVRRLDIFVANQFRNDAAAMAVWERDRRFENPRRTRRAKPAAASPNEPPIPIVPAPAPTVPAVVATGPVPVAPANLEAARQVKEVA